ncbi:MAG: hypothetical protein COA79_20765 [Planctomycetota bacterium]|nr:MAG: hypothetical protein COA79_20765 [Planctomycetota bacterium]
MKIKSEIKLIILIVISIFFMQVGEVYAIDQNGDEEPKKENKEKRLVSKLKQVVLKGLIQRTIKKVSVRKRLVNRATYVLKGKEGLRVKLPTLKRPKKGEKAAINYDKYLGKKVVVTGDAIITIIKYDNRKRINDKSNRQNKKDKKIISLKTVTSIALDK